MDNSTNDMSEKLLHYLDGELTGLEKDELEQQLSRMKELQAGIGEAGIGQGIHSQLRFATESSERFTSK